METPFPPGSHICAYFRDSGGDEQDLSVDQQEHVARAWCLENNVILTRIFPDIARVGSSTVDRVEFDKMLSYFKDDPPEAGLIIWRWSRFARNMDDSQYYRADLRRRGFIVHSINDKIPTGKEGRFFEAALDYWNEKFLEQLSEEVKRGLHDNLREYGVVPGTPPRGFMRQPVQIGSRRSGKPHMASKWVPDPALIPRVKLAWQMRSEHRSYNEIQDATHLYSSINSWNTFFNNRLYIGELIFGETVISNYCEPVIDTATWDAVRAINGETVHRNLRPDSPHNARRSTSSGLLSGLVRCAKCNSPMNIDTVSPRNGPSTSYYRCSRAVRNRDCDMKRINAPWLELQVTETVKTYLLDPRNLANFAQEVQAVDAGQAERLDAERARLKAALGHVTQQVDNTTDAVANAGKSKALLKKLDALEAKQSELETDLAKIETAILTEGNTPQAQPDPAQLSAYMLRRLEQAKKDPQELKRLLRTFIVKIPVTRTDRIVEGEIIYGLPRTKSREPADDPSGAEQLFIPSIPLSMGAHYRRHKFRFIYTIKHRS